MSAALLIHQVGCFHPPMSMSYQPGGARCSHCGQQWIPGQRLRSGPLGPESEHAMTDTTTAPSQHDEVVASLAAAMEDTRDDLAALRNKVDAAIAASLRLPVLDEARAACNEAGIHQARRDLTSAIEQSDAAQTARRAADAAVTLAAERETVARSEAEWELDGRFTVEANKTYLVLDDGSRKQMTADERRTWKTAAADQTPAVAEAKKARMRAEERAAAARDDLAAAERRFSAAKHQLDAAVAVLDTLRVALTIPTNATANGGTR